MSNKRHRELETVFPSAMQNADTNHYNSAYIVESCQSLFPMRILALPSSCYNLMQLATTSSCAFMFITKTLAIIGCLMHHKVIHQV